MKWLERARREILDLGEGRTAINAKRNPTAVMAIQQPAARAIQAAASTSVGNAPLQTLAHEDRRAAFDERAGIIEYDGEVPREWAEGFARLDASRPPADFDARRWRTLIEDGGRFLDRWGTEAAKLGWSAVDVFGVHPTAPAARYDAAGLVLLIGGGEVISIRHDRATIRAKASGSLLTYLRSPRAGGIALWELTGAS